MNRKNDRKKYKQTDKLKDKIINQQTQLIINKVNQTERDPFQCRPQWCRHVKYYTKKQTGNKTNGYCSMHIQNEKQKYTDSKPQSNKQTQKQKREPEKNDRKLMKKKNWHNKVALAI